MERLEVTDAERVAVFSVVECLPVANLALYASAAPALDCGPPDRWTLASAANAAWLSLHADDARAGAALRDFLAWRRRRAWCLALVGVLVLALWAHRVTV